MVAPLVDPADGLTADEVRRYSRHVIIPELGIEGQKRLKNAQVLIIGAGGLGSPALQYLAAAGVGTLGIVDFDYVDESNLQRQVVHGHHDVGKAKTASAAETVHAINPYTTVIQHRVRLDPDNVLDIFAGYDVIVDGTDNFATRYLVNDAAVLLGKPYVWGSIFRFEGQVSVFWDKAGPHYRDLYPEPPPPGMVPSCAEGGVLGVLCSSIGSVMVTETIKLITGIGEPLIGRILVYDALRMQYSTLNLQRDPNRQPVTALLTDYDAFCGAVSVEAGEAAAEATISVSTLAGWLAEREQGTREFILIDVREPHERHINHIDGSVLIPKDEFVYGTGLERLPAAMPTVLFCKSGQRSAEALAVVRGAGFADAVHVAGGISAWVEEIDPTQPDY